MSALLYSVVHAQAPPDCKQGLQKDVLQEEHDSIHHKGSMHTSITQPSGDTSEI